MIVLDASALVDVLLRSPRRAWVLAQVGTQPLCAPTHQLAETLYAVARYTRAGNLSAATARTALDDAADLEQELVAITKGHLRRALELQAGIRVLDGLYVSLAEERGCPLLTTDQRLARSVTTCEVLAPPA